jgi:hypothetical protein
MTGNKVFTLRMPENLRAAIDKRAEKRLRSINNEIVILLKLGLVSETEESEALNTADQYISQIKKGNQKQGGSQRPGK